MQNPACRLSSCRLWPQGGRIAIERVSEFLGQRHDQPMCDHYGRRPRILGKAIAIIVWYHRSQQAAAWQAAEKLRFKGEKLIFRVTTQNCMWVK